MFEHVTAGEHTLAYVFRAGSDPERTTFVTPDAAAFQAGFIVYGAGEEIPRHEHRRIERTVERTSEVLLVRRGSCEVDLYDAKRELVRTLELHRGDIILLLGGGHGFRLLEDTVLFEVKQGPYLGDHEKERF